MSDLLAHTSRAETSLDHVLFADDVEQAQEIAIDLVTLNPNWGAALPPVAAA